MAEKLENASPNQRQVLSIVRLVGGSPAVGRLKQGDMLLAIDEKVVTRFREVELAVADKAEVNVTVWRDGEEKVSAARHRRAHRQRHRPHRHVGRRDAAGAAPRDDRAAGHPARGRLRGLLRLWVAGDPLWVCSRAGVSSKWTASPRRISMHSSRWFRADRTASAIRLRTITWNNAPEVITLKLDQHYWPTYELHRTGEGWERRDLE